MHGYLKSEGVNIKCKREATCMLSHEFNHQNLINVRERYPSYPHSRTLLTSCLVIHSQNRYFPPIPCVKAFNSKMLQKCK